MLTFHVETASWVWFFELIAAPVVVAGACSAVCGLVGIGIDLLRRRLFLPLEWGE